MSIVLLLNVVLFFYQHSSIEKYLKLIIKTVLNVFLMQSWYPNADVNVSLNGVAWFLSVMTFLYFMFPFIAKVLRNISRKSMLFSIIVLVFLLQIVSCVFLIKPLGGTESRVYVWFNYCFPLFRLGDFIVGCGCLHDIKVDSLRCSAIRF